MDNILVYTSGSCNKYCEHIQKVLLQMCEAGLQLDINKSEFEVQSTKYLGFVIEAGKGICIDPTKVEAIMGWESPTSVTGVQSFLGFVNFYCTFIKNYSDLVLPIIQLTHKGALYNWTEQCEQAFQKLKTMVTEGPILVQFDLDTETIIKTDSSG
jgi:hypothetical protein